MLVMLLCCCDVDVMLMWMYCDVDVLCFNVDELDVDVL